MELLLAKMAVDLRPAMTVRTQSLLRGTNGAMKQLVWNPKF